jgi:GNAT superfamily N-acetyltransferase
MLRLRLMTEADLPFVMRLKRQAGWNQTEADLRRFLRLEPEGCFVAEWEGTPAGTVTTCVLGEVGWIAMVLVDECLRGRGVGTALLERALDYLDHLGVPTVRLDATPLGQPLYERLGFSGEYEVVRYGGTPRCPAPGAPILPYEPDLLCDLIALDRQVTGSDRRKLLTALLAEFPRTACVVKEAGRVIGYLSARPGENAAQIGPAVALTETAGRLLLGHALFCASGPVFVDVPQANLAARDLVTSAGLVAQRSFLRMYRGRRVQDLPAALWASSGPEKG